MNNFIKRNEKPLARLYLCLMGILLVLFIPYDLLILCSIFVWILITIFVVIFAFS